MKNINPTQTAAWQALQAHYNDIKDIPMTRWFEDQARVSDFSIQWKDFYVDYSKHRLDKVAKSHLLDLAQQVDLESAIQAYFGGDTINVTEQRAVLHTALRDESKTAFAKAEIDQVKAAMKSFCDGVIEGTQKGATGKSITDVVNIGIGGSDLGPVMVVEALKYYQNHLKMHFVSNVDGDHVAEVIKDLDPERTLFVIVSKTFTTQETLSNAMTIRRWFTENLDEGAVKHHFVAVSTNLEAIESFGIAPEHVFPMWNWVGGRFSLWSAVGLSIALSVGYSKFEALLEGAYEMDQHFKQTPFKDNIPVMMALLSVWYNNFYHAESEAVIPYTQYLHRLPAYLQQAIMESNGKRVDRDGNQVNYQTGNIIWGEPGTNAQHAFFQLIHQGTKLIPADFIGFKQSLHNKQDHHDKLMANFFAQTEALMRGKDAQSVADELEKKGISEEEIERLIPFKIFEGNKPTTTLLINKLTPKTLGALIAMYEHKIFVQGVIWNIYSYDQWGVELGKQLASTILEDLSTEGLGRHDASTMALMNSYKN